MLSGTVIWDAGLGGLFLKAVLIIIMPEMIVIDAITNTETEITRLLIFFLFLFFDKNKKI
jgi:hypothetical protein